MTCDRDRATREGELDFLTWDHPMVVGVMDLLLGGPSESAAVAVMPGRSQGILLETIFVLEPVAPPGLDVSRFLPPTPLRVVVDHRLSDVTSAFRSEALEGRLRDGRKELRYRNLEFLESLLPRMLDRARSFAETQKPRRIEESLEEMRAKLGAEGFEPRLTRFRRRLVARFSAEDLARDRPEADGGQVERARPEQRGCDATSDPRRWRGIAVLLLGVGPFVGRQESSDLKNRPGSSQMGVGGQPARDLPVLGNSDVAID